ncbi:AraC family transcriptional regulator [Pelomonas sp. V22]|uniref:helix-turn-helix domain-containing protein n=1 Tax=Pelomonas sp. V22 TaxID=2822139 RepID=UPI0024A93224|nr:helix-turn-helix domain-containing protein [Pelomonas sp. V22]MDI4633691.1 AraC family transcriptional regulator [Pelomonas sp. V22]
MIRFGSMSTVLLLGALYGALFMLLLWWTPRNRVANRFLALLLAVIALQLLPYIIGYAGFYDAFPWLSYLPYEASLAFGPLLYFYARSLSRPQLPPRWGWHFAPVLLQLAYYGAIFVRPLAFKNAWNDATHVPYIVPLEQLATFTSIACYWGLSLRDYRGYQRWLADSVSDCEDHNLEWLRNFLIALGVTLLLWAGLAALQRWVVKLNYFEEFPFYLWFALLSYYLGTEGYRHAGHRYPVWAEMPAAPAMPPPQPAARAGINWAERGQRWRQQVQEQGWWRDPELSLQELARLLGTNTSDLSRAFNEGLGQNFNELINRMRVEAIQQALQAGNAGRGLLDIALEAGFSSKASFNRCFKLYAGETPSAYAARLKS